MAFIKLILKLPPIQKNKDFFKYSQNIFNHSNKNIKKI